MNTDNLMVISDDEYNIEKFDDDESRLYIDEHVSDSTNNSSRQSTKSVNTGNAFELDSMLIANINRYRTRSTQTILTSNRSLLLKRHRSTFCQAEYFETLTQETNTDYDGNNEEERILVVKKQRTENVNMLLSPTH